MPKVDKTHIIIPKKKAVEVKVGDEHGDLKVSQIDVTDNATYVYVQNEEGVETAYGAKIFLSKFKS